MLSVVMMAGLVIANRMPRLEGFALERNAACYGLSALIALIPVIRFWRSPGQLFTSGIIGWIVFTLAYTAAGNFFSRLHQVRTPGVLLAYGAVVYALIAVVLWVAEMLREAVHHAPAQARRRPHPRHVTHS